MSQDLYIKEVRGKGRGVFCNEEITKGTIIEFCPVIVLSSKDRPHLDKTFLYDYYFEWGLDQKESALALGYGSLYNHNYEPNAEYETFFEEKMIVIRALRTIPAHEEITISYNQNPDDKRKVWFEKKR